MKLATSLHPLVVIYFPRFSVAVRDTLECVVRPTEGCRAIAHSASAEESALYAQVWKGEDRCALLIIREPLEEDRNCVAAIQLVLESEPHRPGAVLFIEPDPRNQRQTDRVSRQLAKQYSDLQVIEYAPSWKQSPPRIR